MAILYNLGCKLNQYEGGCLFQKFTDEDVVILNTCCVTKEAEQKSFRKFRSLQKKFPDRKIIVTGCTCRLCPEQFAGAHRIIDNVARCDLIRDVFPQPHRSRYFLKIQDGCNQPCTYCVVSKLRNRIESKPIELVIKEIAWAKTQNFREIVLVGANIGLYGMEAGTSLEGLIARLSEVPGLPRVRISSCEPKFINAGLIARLKMIPFCRHFHIPIQSADDSVLRQMGRGYNAAFLKEKIELITADFKGAAIGADIIVGFPGEGEREFENTYQFIQDGNFMHLHVFPYSPRPITEAYKLGDVVPHQEKKRRLWRLKEMIKTKNFQFRQSMVGGIYEAIIEKHAGGTFGLTDNYVRVAVEGGGAEKELVRIQITNADQERTYGRAVG